MKDDFKYFKSRLKSMSNTLTTYIDKLDEISKQDDVDQEDVDYLEDKIDDISSSINSFIYYISTYY